MIDTKTAPYAALLLRLSMGLLFLLHGTYLKGMVFGYSGSAGFFASLGLPGWFAGVVILYETLGALMLIFGVFTRPAAVFLGLHLLGVAFVGHGGNGWLFAAPGGGWEYPLFWAVACFALALIGDGAMALKPWGARAEA